MKKICSVLVSLVFCSSVFCQALSELTEKCGFKMGAVISASTVASKSYKNLVIEDFNSITASNEFKAYSLVNQSMSASSPNGMPVMNYTSADLIAKFAQENNIGIRGHVLVWDAYMPAWFFREKYSNSGKLVDRNTMIERLEYYINDVVLHFEQKFPGVVYCWDVVNEAVSDSTRECNPSDNRRVRILRGNEKNLFYEVIGDDYVELSFKFAKNAVNKVNPNIKLFYNDYNTFYPEKRNAITNLIESINQDEKLCDGVGMQGYIGGYGSQNGCLNDNDLRLVENAIKHYGKLDLEVQLTEVALRNYDKNAMTRHSEFYKKFFTMLSTINKENNNFTGLTIWGLVDDPNMSKSSYSYKMNGPYCGLYSKNLEKKPVFDKIIEVLK